MEQNMPNESGARSGQQTGRQGCDGNKFSPEEMKVLQECNTESFFQRSLPIGTLLGLSTFYGVKAGYLKPHARWGPTPKVMLAVTLGYFIGKFSYQNKCAEKFMKLPNSRFGEMLRQRRKRHSGENLEESGFASVATQSFANVAPSKMYSDEMPRNYDLDSYRPDMSDAAGIPQENIMNASVGTPTSSGRSYEELRKHNRSEFQKTRGANYRTADIQPTKPLEVAGSSPLSSFDSNLPDPSMPSHGRRNQYGDPVD